MKRLLFAALALLAACGTPQEQCISRNTRDLRVVDRLITQTEGNLKRGYALEQVTEYQTRWVRCRPSGAVEGGYEGPQMCLDDFPVTVTRPKAIDLKDEAQKLAGLKAKRAMLASQANSVVAQCKALHPE